MKTIVITLIGPDRPGIVEQVSKQVADHQGNWLSSSLSLMAGQFAGLIEVNLPESELASLRQSLEQLAGFSIQLVDGLTDSPSPKETIEFLVTANDRPGIIQQVSACLTRLGVNVLQLDTLCESAAHFGGHLFTAQVVAQLPDSLSPDELWQALESISDDLMIDTE